MIAFLININHKTYLYTFLLRCLYEAMHVKDSRTICVKAFDFKQSICQAERKVHIIITCTPEKSKMLLPVTILRLDSTEILYW